MDCVIVTNGSRPGLLDQTLRSLRSNAILPRHRVIVAWDDGSGACAARNRGVGAFRSRGRHLLIADDDCYFAPRWDIQLARVLEGVEEVVVSGHAHPYNAGDGFYEIGWSQVEEARVLSTVQLAMSWKVWDKVGELHGVGGPGGSEDIEWCARAQALGVKLAVTHPHCVLHCGLTNSLGKELVGAEFVRKRNEKLVAMYKLKGEVIVE